MNAASVVGCGGSVAVSIVILSCAAMAADNNWSVRFFATGYNQQDRARFQIDDDLPFPAPDASKSADIGAGSFTIEFWVKGILAENNTTPRSAGDHSDYNWITGNVVIDRDVYNGSNRKFGISIRGGRVEFGTGDGDGIDSDHTLVSSGTVLNNAWRHVAVTRDAMTGTKRIYIDGTLDETSAPGVSTADLSYPNDGVLGQAMPCGQGPWGPYLTVGTEKNDTDEDEETCGNPPTSVDYPGFKGRIDEVRLWKAALSSGSIAALYDKVLTPAAYPDLVAYWRFEEGTGTYLGDAVPGGTPGTLIAGIAGNGEWSSDTPAVTGVLNWSLY